MGEQPIANQYTGRNAPYVVKRWAVSSFFRPIQYVVMHKSRGVQQLYDGSEPDRLFGNVATGFRTQQRQDRSQSFSTKLTNMVQHWLQ
jgi:hypothetical protein